MKPRQIIFLSVLLMLLVGAVVFKKSQTPAYLAHEITKPLELSFEKEKIKRIVLKQGDETIEITNREEEGWSLPLLWNAQGNEARVNQLLEKLSNLRGELRSDNPKLLADYGLDDEEAVRIDLFEAGNNKPVFSLWVGLKEPGGRGAFVREPDSAKVFVLNASLLETLGASKGPDGEFVWQEGFWDDRRIFRVPAENVEQLSFKRQDVKTGGTFHLFREENGWKFNPAPSVFEADGAKVEDLLQLLSGAQALRVVDPAGQYGLEKPLVEIAFVLKDKEGQITYRLGVTEGESPAYYLRTSEDPAVFEISLFYAKRLDVYAKHFLQENPFSFEDEDVHAVILRKGTQEKFVDASEDSKEIFEQKKALLKNLVYEVAIFSSDNFASPEPATQFVILDQDQAEKVFEFGEVTAENNGRVPFRIQEDERIFTISTESFESLFSPL